MRAPAALLLVTLATGFGEDRPAGPTWAPGELACEDSSGCEGADSLSSPEPDPDAAAESDDAPSSAAGRPSFQRLIAFAGGFEKARPHPIRGPPVRHL